MSKHHPEPIESPIVKDLCELSGKVAQLHAVIHRAKNKFSPVLIGAHGTCEGTEIGGPKPEVPRIEQEIRYLGERLDDAIAEMEHLVERAQC